MHFESITLYTYLNSFNRYISNIYNKVGIIYNYFLVYVENNYVYCKLIITDFSVKYIILFQVF